MKSSLAKKNIKRSGRRFDKMKNKNKIKIVIEVFEGKIIKFDVGKNEVPIFVLIQVLSYVINRIAHIGFKQEEEEYKKKWERK